MLSKVAKAVVAFCLVVVFGRNRSATSFAGTPLFALKIAAHSSCTEDPSDDHAQQKNTGDEDDVLDGHA